MKEEGEEVYIAAQHHSHIVDDVLFISYKVPRQIKPMLANVDIF
jgi:hypothetical protein